MSTDQPTPIIPTEPIAGDRFIVMGNGNWGKGADLAAAKATYKAHGGSLAQYVVVEALQEPGDTVLDVWVSRDGAVCWDWVEGKERRGVPTLIVRAKRGFDVEVGQPW